ncbi:MAG: 4Fe-4S binding protein, partial [Chloroflexota bacterium]
EGASLTLTFDPRRCTACQLCVPRCPEGPAVLRVERRTRARDLVAGRVALHRDEQERCRVCGGPVAPRAMLRRVATLLGDDAAALAVALERTCSTCRQVRPTGVG